MKYSYSFLFIILFISCQKEISFYDLPLTSPGGEAPIIEGYYKTYNNGTSGGIVGKPLEVNQLYDNAHEIRYINIYPNPCIDTFYADFYFTFMIPTRVKCFLIAGKATESLNKSVLFNTVFNIKEGFALYSDEIITPKHSINSTTVTIDLKPNSKNGYINIPLGYYRLYFRTDRNLYWQDLFINR